MDDRAFALVKQLRHELHEHPELSNEEHWTKSHLVEFLRRYTALEIVDRGSWFYAVYRSEKEERRIAFRADYDAIPMEESLDLPYGSKVPGVAHKCGHDGHAASLAGFALEIDRTGSDNSIFFLFQPAEETGEGAVQCTPFIKENDIDEIFAYHNMSGIPCRSIAVIDGTAACASRGMILHFEGAPSHASAPEKGRNPAYAIGKVLCALPDLADTRHTKGLVLCTVIQVAVGERAFGVSAGTGELLLTIRALFEDELDALQSRIEGEALRQAGQYELTVRFSTVDSFPETVNHKESSDKVRDVAREKGYELVELSEPHRGSEDFGYFTKETKGAMFYIGNGEDYPPLHTHAYDFRDELIPIAVAMFKGLAEGQKGSEKASQNDEGHG